MDWIKLRVNTSAQGIEPVSACMYSVGVTGLEIEDGAEFIEFIKNKSVQWDYVEDELVIAQSQKTGVIAYLSDDAAGRDTLALIKNELSRLSAYDVNKEYGDLEITINTLNEEDWANNWKKYFKPIEIGERVLIKPEWEELTDPTNRVVFTVNPGMNFGTGSHYTTQLCIEALENYVKAGESEVADIGCGSGILSIIALQLGAKNALALDIDPSAVDNAYLNASLNGINENYEVLSGDILNDKSLLRERKYDIILANIIADVIIPLSSAIPEFLKEDGVFISSGIINNRRDDVMAAIEAAGMQVLKIYEREDWLAISAVHRQNK